MSQIVGGDKSSIPADKKIIVPTLGIDKDKVEEFSTKLKGLRGR